MSNLSQLGIDIVPGNIYKLTFNTDIVSGNLKVYQGTQLIYDTGIVKVGSIGTARDLIYVTERISIDRRSNVNNFEVLNVIDLITLEMTPPLNHIENITLTEAITLSIV